MLVVLPWTVRHKRTWGACRHAAAELGFDFRPAKMTSDTSYYHLLSELWTGGEDFLIVEHDIVPRLDNFRRMAECRKAWCLNPYAGPDKIVLTKSHGFTRYRTSFCAQYPDVMDKISEHGWHALDSRLYTILDNAGEYPHVHTPLVEHLHAYPRSDWVL